MIDIERVRGPCKPNSYIVKLHDTVSKTAHLQSLSSQLSGDSDSNVTHNYDSAFFKAFAGTFSQSTLDVLRESPDVDYIVEDSIMTTQDVVTQNDAPWGLSRISQTNPIIDAGTSSLTYSYRYNEQAGEGVDIYIIDTGINTEHEDFGGRARWGATFGDYADHDGNGHGTHCAGTAAGTKYGVAKKANLIAVKILSDEGSGATSDIINGIDWVISQAQGSSRPSVASLSLGGPANRALDQAIAEAVSRGIIATVAAGNDNRDARNTSPAREPSAITVGASDINDKRSRFSNYGAAVDIFAPGTDIPSAWIGSSTATNVISGTSMATPHVAGYVAYLLSVEENKDPAAIKTRLHKLSTDGILKNIPRGTVNEIIRNDVNV